MAKAPKETPLDDSKNEAQYQVLTSYDMTALEQIAQRIVDARGSEYKYQTAVGVTVTFTPPKKEEK